MNDDNSDDAHHDTAFIDSAVQERSRQRRIEFVMESFRWDDMMRWKEGTTFVEQFKGI